LPLLSHPFFPLGTWGIEVFLHLLYVISSLFLEIVQHVGLGDS